MFPASWLSCLYKLFYFALLHSLSHQTTTVDTDNRIRTDTALPETMYSTTFVLALGFTLAVLSSAAPVSERASTRRSLFTPVCCQENPNNNTGVANVTVGGFPDHKHNPDCEHKYNTTKGQATEGNDHATKTMGNPSPYQGFNASAYVHPHAIQGHNHTGDHCSHPSHHNTTSTDATYDNQIHSKMLNASADSSHTHTGSYCSHPSHHNGSTTTGHSYDKKSVIPRVDITVCMGADCKDSTTVKANVNEAGVVTGVDAGKSKSKRMGEGQDREISYEDVARQMSGGEIAGGV